MHLCQKCAVKWLFLIGIFNLIFQGEMCASTDIFAHLTHLLMNLAGGKLCAVLEVRLDAFIPKVSDLHSHLISFLEFCGIESSTSQIVKGITV